MSFESVAWALEAPVGGTQKVLLIGIASHADRYGDNAWPSIETLAKYAHVTPRAVQMALNALVKAGYLYKGLNEGGTRHTAAHMRPNLYRLNIGLRGEVDPLKPASPPEASFTPPLKPASPHPLKPASPEQSIEPSLNHPNTKHTIGGGESVGVCVEQTPQGLVCKAMRAQGLADTNPGHALLRALLDAGADLAEFSSAAADAVARKKGFSYALGIVANRRKDAAGVAESGSCQGAVPAKRRRRQTFAEVDRDNAMNRWEAMTGRAHPDRGLVAASPANVIDMEPRRELAIQSH